MVDVSFYSAYRHGFVRVAACTLHTTIGDPAANAESVLAAARECHDDGVALAVFPELTLSGYSIDDILMQETLLETVEEALGSVVAASTELLPVLVVGAPLRYRNRLYNTAVVIHRGTVLGVVPKSYLPTYREFYERRQVAPGDDVRGEIVVCGAAVPFGPALLFGATDLPGFVVHVEICEDMWVPVPPSARAALAGATVLANLSGSPITVGRADERKLLARSASARCVAAYLYAAAGEGESSTDLAWDGQTMIYENGVLLAESERFPKGAQRSVADVDTELLRAERLRMGTFDDNRRTLGIGEDEGTARRIGFTLDPPDTDIGLRRNIERFPFVPSDPARLQQDCYEAYNIQVSGLEQRLRALKYPKVVIGVSGGLDSTHALIVAARAMDREDRPRSDILAFTMPGFATGEHTKGNAIALCKSLGVTFAELDIRETARLMLAEMDHPFARGEKVYDVTFEQFDDEVGVVLQAILDTEITPELVPTDGGEPMQSSEAKVGPYALQDFSLYQVLRFGFRPSKIAFLAWHAWRDAEQGHWPLGYPLDKRPAYSLNDIRHWLTVFVQRFYSFSQFKRSALPNGPKVSSGGALSPRGDWRAPSDMSARIWLDEIERHIPVE